MKCLAALSLLLAVAVLALWVRGHHFRDKIESPVIPLPASKHGVLLVWQGHTVPAWFLFALSLTLSLVQLRRAWLDARRQVAGHCPQCRTCGPVPTAAPNAGIVRYRHLTDPPQASRPCASGQAFLSATKYLTSLGGINVRSFVALRMTRWATPPSFVIDPADKPNSYRNTYPNGLTRSTCPVR